MIGTHTHEDAIFLLGLAFACITLGSILLDCMTVDYITVDCIADLMHRTVYPGRDWYTHEDASLDFAFNKVQTDSVITKLPISLKGFSGGTYLWRRLDQIMI